MDCPHTHTRLVPMPKGHPKYAKRVCERCDKLRGYVSRTEAPEDRQELVRKAQELLERREGTSATRGFLIDVVTSGGACLGPKDESLLNGLWARAIVQDELNQIAAKRL